jgi:hypothetical protein
MKKIIALALALIMALSMASVAFAADPTVNPGDEIVLDTNMVKKDWKISYDFTTASAGYNGASMIESVEFEKQPNKTYNLVVNLKESLTGTTAKELKGMVTLTSKVEGVANKTYSILDVVGNNVLVIDGAKKADNATELRVNTELKQDTVLFFEDNGGYVGFTIGQSLYGLAKVAKGAKVQTYFLDKAATALVDEDTVDAIDAYLGEDYEGIVEFYNFAGTGIEDVAFQYDAYAEDPHYFYAWDGEALTKIDATFDADEDVDAYVFTADAANTILVVDTEIVLAAEETKNPDTGANDVVGVAAALAVVSLVAAGAVSLKK